MAPHSNTLAWKIPWTEEPGRLQSVESLRVGHDWATSLSCTGEGNGNPLQCSRLENPRDGGAWWAAVYGVAQSRTRLKRLSSSSSSSSTVYSFPSAIVIYCWVTDYNTLRDLLQHTFIASQFLWVEFGHGFTEPSTAESLTRLQSGCQQGLGSHLKGQLGKNLLLDSSRYRQNSVLWDYWTEGLSSWLTID